MGIKVTVEISIGRRRYGCERVGICDVIISAELSARPADHHGGTVLGEAELLAPTAGTTDQSLRISLKEDLSIDVKSLPIDAPILIPATQCGFQDFHLVVRPGRYVLTNNVITLPVIAIPVVNL